MDSIELHVAHPVSPVLKLTHRGPTLRSMRWSSFRRPRNFHNGQPQLTQRFHQLLAAGPTLRDVTITVKELVGHLLSGRICEDSSHLAIHGSGANINSGQRQILRGTWDAFLPTACCSTFTWACEAWLTSPVQHTEAGVHDPSRGHHQVAPQSV